MIRGNKMKKYTAAISDTDILINLAKVDRLDLLSLLFSKIIIPFLFMIMS